MWPNFFTGFPFPFPTLGRENNNNHPTEAVTDGTVTDYNLLFQWADAALYQVKSKGKGAYYLLDVKEGVALPGKSYLDSEENKEDEIAHKEAQFESAEDLVLFCMDLLENVPNLTCALKVICERT